VGNDPLPAWGKRKAGEDPIESGKRPRVKCVVLWSFTRDNR
jgi:hypothetical protein